jgi:hypothetical protein
MKAGTLQWTRNKGYRTVRCCIPQERLDLRRDILVLLSVTDVFLRASSHTQPTTRDKISYMFLLEKVIIRLLTTTSKKKN